MQKIYGISRGVVISSRGSWSGCVCTLERVWASHSFACPLTSTQVIFPLGGTISIQNQVQISPSWERIPVKKLWLATQAHWIIKVKSQRTGEFAMRLAPSDVRRYTHKVSSAWLPTHDLSKDHTKDMLNRSGCGKDQEASTQRTTGD